MIKFYKNCLKKIFISIIFINIIALSTNAFSATYWSNVQDGPYSVEQAKKKFEGRRIDPIEGIWFSDGLGTLVIFKKNDKFKMYIIDVEDSGVSRFERTWEATFIKKSNYSNAYNFFGRIWYVKSSGGFDCCYTQTGEATVASANDIFWMIYDERSREGVLMDSKYLRVWPTNFDIYNSQFSQKKEKVRKKFKRSKPKTQYTDYWWVVVLLGLLAFFLYVTTVKKSKVKIKSRTKKKDNELKKILKPYWQGKVSYGYSFWIYLTLIGSAISIPALFLGYIASDAYWYSMSDIGVAVAYLYFIFLIAAKIYLIVGTWRSAENYKILKKKKKQGAAWAYIGQFYIVLSIIRSIAMIIKG
jgi:hypothetical protein|tara:strand:- start:79 stop:1149 length:1071 start_codon:yes stop_codon:yes gene_type:complete